MSVRVILKQEVPSCTIFVQDAVCLARPSLKVYAIDAFQIQYVEDAANIDQDSFHFRFHVGFRVLELGFITTRVGRILRATGVSLSGAKSPWRSDENSHLRA